MLTPPIRGRAFHTTYVGGACSRAGRASGDRNAARSLAVFWGGLEGFTFTAQTRRRCRLWLCRAQLLGLMSSFSEGQVALRRQAGHPLCSGDGRCVMSICDVTCVFMM